MHQIEKNIRERIKVLKLEIIHGNYYDGWTLNGMKEELETLEIELKKITDN